MAMTRSLRVAIGTQLLFVALCACGYAQSPGSDSTGDHFAADWFDGDYKVLVGPEMADSQTSRLRVATRYATANSDFFDSAVFYSESDGQIRIRGIVVGPRIFSGDGVQILNLSESPGEFFGWRLQLLNVDDPSNFGVVFRYYADGGARVSHVASVGWDSSSKQLSHVEPDRSQW